MDEEKRHVNPIIGRLETALRTAHPELLAAHAPGAAVEQINELEGIVGKPLPQTLRDLLGWRNGVGGQAARATIDGPWNLMSVQAITDAIEMRREMLE